MTGAPVDDVLADLIDRYGGLEALQPYDEAVSELEHALQCAALAEAAGVGDALVAAALLHDVGHLVVHDLSSIETELRHDSHHERAGAQYLRRWFGPEVTEPVRLHVAAKRYLCAVEPGYGAGLSPSSVRSLSLQGGPMTPHEIEEFEAEPGSGAAVEVRRWDDLAKVVGARVPPFAHYLTVLRRLVNDPGR